MWWVVVLRDIVPQIGTCDWPHLAMAPGAASFRGVSGHCVCFGKFVLVFMLATAAVHIEHTLMLISLQITIV